MEGKFPCVVCRKCVGINSILISFTGVRSLTDVVLLEVNWKGTISLMSDMHRIKWPISWNCGKVLLSSVITRIRSGWSKFRDLVPLLATGGFSLGANDRYSTCVSNVMLYGTETWPVKEQNDSRLQRTMM